MIDFDMGSLSIEQLEQALENAGYILREESDELNARAQGGIEEIEHVHPVYAFSYNSWMYEVVYKDDGSFNEDEGRQGRRGKLYVKFNPVTLQVVAEF